MVFCSAEAAHKKDGWMVLLFLNVEQFVDSVLRKNFITTRIVFDFNKDIICYAVLIHIFLLSVFHISSAYCMCLGTLQTEITSCFKWNHLSEVLGVYF